MNVKKILIFLYKKISIIYIFIFGRKSMQFFNDIVLSLSLNAKGFKNYGNFNLTGEKKFVKLIGREINFSIDIGANVGMYSIWAAVTRDISVISIEPESQNYAVLNKTILLNNLKDKVTALCNFIF